MKRSGKPAIKPLTKVIIAAHIIAAVVMGKIDEKEASKLLREAGLQWAFLTCLQYMSGKEARGAVEALPDEWAEEGVDKQALLQVIDMAADAVANGRGDGVALCASELAKSKRRAAT